MRRSAVRESYPSSATATATAGAGGGAGAGAALEAPFWIPQGGAMAGAKDGLDLLGADIEQFLATRLATTPATTATTTIPTVPFLPSTDVSRPVSQWSQCPVENTTTPTPTRCQIFVESGTGTTALFLHRYFQRKQQQQSFAESVSGNSSSSGGGSVSRGGGGDGDGDAAESTMSNISVTVTAVPCVMSPADLLSNMRTILRSVKHGDGPGKGIVEHDAKDFPAILTLPVPGYNMNSDVDIEPLKKEKFVPFGTPQTSHLAIWKYLTAETGIVFDLLYAPKAFEQIFRLWDEEHYQSFAHTNKKIIHKDYEDNNDGSMLYIYVHCGGAEGNASQLNRYKYLKLMN